MDDSKSGSSMICVVARLNIKEASMAPRFKEICAEMGEKVHASQPGTLLYCLCVNPADATKYTVLELYKDMDAVKQHQAEFPAMATEEMMSMLVPGPPDMVVMPVIGKPGLKAAGGGTVAVIADLSVKDSAKFEKMSIPMAEQVHGKEPGNLLYCMGKHPSEADRYLVLELYMSEEARMQHGKSEHYQSSMAALSQVADGLPRLEVMDTSGDAFAKPTHH